jgi:hypothetical protein
MKLIKIRFESKERNFNYYEIEHYHFSEIGEINSSLLYICKILKNFVFKMKKCDKIMLKFLINRIHLNKK